MRLILAQSNRRDDDEKLLFMQICKNHEDSKTEHQKKLGWTITRFAKVIGRLVTQGFLNIVELQLGESGRPCQALELTDRGNKEVEMLGLKPPRTGKGGLKHLVYIMHLEHALQADGYQTKREYLFPGPGIYIDLLAWKEREMLAIEIELSDAGHLIERLERLLEANLVEKINVFSDSKEIITKSKRLFNMKSCQIEYFLIQEFFKKRRHHEANKG
jgi:hypothetical protein